MLIRYHVDLEDMNAYLAHHLSVSPAAARLLVTLQVWLVLLGLVVGLVVGILAQQVLLCVGLGLFAGAMAAGGIKPLMLRLAIKRGLRGYEQEEGVLGERELELDDSALWVRCDAGESKLHVSEVMRIDHGPLHAFIYLAEGPTVVVPRGRVVDGDLDALLDTLERRI